MKIQTSRARGSTHNQQYAGATEGNKTYKTPKYEQGKTIQSFTMDIEQGCKDNKPVKRPRLEESSSSGSEMAGPAQQASQRP